MKYRILSDGEDGIKFQGKIGLIDPSIVLKELLDGNITLKKNEEVTEINDNRRFRYYHSIEYYLE